MLEKMRLTSLANPATLNTGGIFLYLLLLALFIRFPFFFRDYIDRDESTFILVGQSLVNGHLPFTQLWDLKPPLVYFLFAGVIYLFGKSLIAIRVIGVLAVAVTAFAAYGICRNISTKAYAFWAGIGTVLLLSLFGSMQGVMSEHLSMAFFVPGLYFLVTKNKLRYILLAGLCCGAAIMCKLNLAYAVMLVGLYFLLSEALKRDYSRAVKSGLIFSAGIAAVVALSFLPYLLAGKADIWFDSVVLAPLEYSEARRASWLKLSPVVLIVGFFLWLSFRKSWLDFNNKTVQIISLAMAGVVFSFLKVGKVNGHYLIQLYPLLLILLVSVLGQTVNVVNSKWKPWLLTVLFLLPAESYREYLAIGLNKLNKGTFFNGEGIEVPQYYINNGLNHQGVLFLEYHIGYWMLDELPPTRAATHPSNLCREELFPYFENPRATSMAELRYIMEELQPPTIVVRYGKPVFHESMEEQNLYMQHQFSRYYSPHAMVGEAQILKRL